LDGIIALLTERCGGNVHDHGLVDITSLNGRETGKWAADLNASSRFVSGFGPGQWLCYDFKARLILLTGYSIRSQVEQGPGKCHPRHWVVETSMNGTDWTVVDERKDNFDLNDADRSVYFDIHGAHYCVCRFVRLRQTGMCHANNHYLCLTAFELFGDLSG
jgi:hypothetical protein